MSQQRPSYKPPVWVVAVLAFASWLVAAYLAGAGMTAGIAVAGLFGMAVWVFVTRLRSGIAGGDSDSANRQVLSPMGIIPIAGGLVAIVVLVAVAAAAHL